MMKVPFVDLKPQYAALKTEIQKGIDRVLEHGQFVMGPEVKELEARLEEFTGGAKALAVSSGTDALVIALMALDLKPGDEVITTSFSFFATAETIVLLGLVPVFVDIDPVTYNLDPTKIEAAITKKTKVIMPVSLYGQPADMTEINALAQAHGLKVIEDAAQSFGALYQGARSCNLSDIGATSFFPAKPLGCYGDGGAVFTKDPEILDRMDQIRNHGQTTRYHHVRLGLNGRLDTLQCAILLTKLDRYQWEMEKRQEIAQAYNEGLKGLDPDHIKIPVVRDDRTSVWAQYTLRVPNRDELQRRLMEMGVPTSVHYPKPMHLQPALQGSEVRHDLSETLKAAEEVLCFPLYADMPRDHVDYVVETLHKCLKG